MITEAQAKSLTVIFNRENEDFKALTKWVNKQSKFEHYTLFNRLVRRFKTYEDADLYVKINDGKHITKEDAFLEYSGQMLVRYDMDTEQKIHG